MITKEEYELLKYYHATGYGWIARDKSKMLYVYNCKPFKVNRVWDTSDDDTSYSYILYSCHNEKDMHCQLTQSEIESVDPILMKIAKEVE